MHVVIRQARFISFIFLVVFAVGCSLNEGIGPAPGAANRPLIEPPASAERPKIIAFGDSLTAGFGLTEQESYPYLLQRMLNADGYNYEVVNAGVSGDTTLGGLERIDWVLEDKKVEIIIIELGANDLLRGVPAKKMRSNLDAMIRKAKDRDVKVLLCGMLAPPTMGADYQQEFTLAFPELAAEHKVAFLPFVLENVAMRKELNQADGIHPNPEGTRIMAENIYAALKPLLVK